MKSGAVPLIPLFNFSIVEKRRIKSGDFDPFTSISAVNLVILNFENAPIEPICADRVDQQT